MRDHDLHRALTERGDDHGRVAPGKTTRSGALQRKAIAPAAGAASTSAAPASTEAAWWFCPPDPTAPIQRVASEPSVAAPPLPAPGGGQAMPAPVQAKMEAAFGTDFGDVRIHEGPHAAAMGAVAYAQGSDVHFQPGAYDPSSTRGQELLGHELTHVVQQRSGKVQPQGKDSPINADPALEAEADVMGARAARGEATGMAVTGGGSGGTAVQRYRAITDDGKPWRQSDDLHAMVQTDDAPGARSKDFFAESDAIATADNKLKNAGSFISLSAGESRKGQHKVVPTFIGPGSDNDRVYGHAKGTSGDDLAMPSDCNNSARIIMGIAHEPLDVGDEPDRTAETPVANEGDRETHARPRRDFRLNKFGAKETLVERNGLSELTGSMIEYAKALPERPIASDPLKNKSNGVDLFLDRSKRLGDDGPVAWTLLFELREHHAALYQDFNKWSGMNQQARPEVGDALVTFLPGGPAISKTSQNPKAYRAFVEILKEALGDHAKRQTLAENLGEVTKQAEREFARVERSLEQERKREQQILLDIQEQTRLLNLTEDKGALEKKIGVLRTTTLVLCQASIKRLEAELIKVRATRDLAVGVMSLLRKPGADKGKLARKALALIGVTPESSWDGVRDQISQNGVAHDSFGGDIGQEMVEAIKGNDLWNKHWGGVVMTLGSDYVTLENDASTAPESGPDLNGKWGFAMYGSKTAGQSFHDQMMSTGDFGTFAVTARMTAPGTKGEKARRGRALRPDPDEAVWLQADALFARIGAESGPLLRLLEQMTLGSLRTLEERYTCEAYDTPDAETQAMIVALIPRARQRHAMKPPLTHDRDDWGGPSEHDHEKGKNHPTGAPPPGIG